MFCRHFCSTLYPRRGQLFGYRLRGAIHKFVCFIQDHCIALGQNWMVVNNFNREQGVIGDNHICLMGSLFGFYCKTL